MEDRIKKMREERAAREHARIIKLRELNLKKYPKNETQPSNSANPSSTNARSASISQLKTGAISKTTLAIASKPVKSSSHVNCTNKRPITAPTPIPKPDYSNIKSKVVTKFANNNCKVDTIKLATNNGAVRNTQKEGKALSKITNQKPSRTDFNAMSKPDVVNTKDSGDKKKAFTNNILNSDATATVNDNGDDKPATSNNQDELTSKPDIIMETGDNDKSNKEKQVLTDITKKRTINTKLFVDNNIQSRKSLAAPSNNCSTANKSKIIARKSMLPRLTEDHKSETVFERLYKPKFIAKKVTDQKTEAEKPNYLKKAVKNSDFPDKFQNNAVNDIASQHKFQRRSISAVHFKRISKNETSNCIKKWGSIGKGVDKIGLKNEDDSVLEEKVVSAVKSERKKVQFMTPSFSNFNTPRPEELQARLKSWLQKRGKSLSLFHHLQCFDLHHSKMNLDSPKSMQYEDAVQSPSHLDEENKENIALDSESDNDSITELIGKKNESLSYVKEIDTTNWRNVSLASESVFNDSCHSNFFNDTTLTPTESLTNTDELLYGALNELSILLREGFDWQQAARWLRSIRARFPHASKTAAYWECRAALEDARGDFIASVQCWEEAIAKGTEKSVVDYNLDQLLNKFMQLKISPRSNADKHIDPKLVDVKNVFKSTVIRFALQQAKLRNSNPSTPKAVPTVTPVRRSTRLSTHVSRTPLRLCDTMQQAATLAPDHVFTPNDNFVSTP